MTTHYEISSHDATDHPELSEVAGGLQQKELPLPGVEEAEGGHRAEQEGSVVLA